MRNFIIEKHKVVSFLASQNPVFYHIQEHGILIDLETDLAWLLPKALPAESGCDSDFSNLKWKIGPLKKWADGSMQIRGFQKKLQGLLRLLMAMKEQYRSL